MSLALHARDEAKIEQRHAPLRGDAHVGGLQISVDNAVLVQRGESIRKLAERLAQPLFLKARVVVALPDVRRSWPSPVTKGDSKDYDRYTVTILLTLRVEIAERARKRLSLRYRKMTARGIAHPKAVAAVARELAGFLAWAVGCPFVALGQEPDAKALRFRQQNSFNQNCVALH